MSNTTYRFNTVAEVSITVDGSDEDEATYDEAVRRITAALDSLGTGMGTDGVRIDVSIDGAEPDEVTEDAS